ncbi:MAG: M23 family metallopeptidase [Myxococcales bacterium]|nr:M23 family metallopeptidase [Myxococcales bacterium]
MRSWLLGGALAIAALTRAAEAGPSLDEQLDAQAASVARAREQVLAKQHERQRARVQRVRLAYKLLRDASAPLTIAPGERMAVARGRATARLLLARDRAEVTLLAREVDSLTSAALRIDADRARATAPPADLRLRRPVAGAIARRFGTLVHDDSRAVLARRGLDFEVARDAEVVAPADGIVRYAGPIRGLDRGAVLDHGGVWTVVGKLGELAVATGDHVEAGQRLGTPHKTRVYFEVRVPVGPGGLPVDPEPYLLPR